LVAAWTYGWSGRFGLVRLTRTVIGVARVKSFVRRICIHRLPGGAGRTRIPE
jgi:hypothetical protein